MKHRIHSILRNFVGAIMALVILGVSATFGLAVLGIVSAIVIFGLVCSLFAQRNVVQSKPAVFSEIHPTTTGVHYGMAFTAKDNMMADPIKK